MRRILFFVSITLNLFFLSAAVPAQEPTEESRAIEAVKVFYRYHFSHENNFDKKEVARRRKFFTPKLRQLFDAELKRRQIYSRKYPDNKPFFEVLPFQPIEFCNKDYRVETAQAERQKAVVTVNFVYGKSSCDSNDGTQISYKFLLLKTSGKWLINDVIYDDESTLTEDFSIAQKIK